MFADASALVAILIEEPDYLLYASALGRSEQTFITEFVRIEVGMALMGGRGLGADEAFRGIETLLRHFRIETVPLTSEMILIAMKASERYGKGRGHPAKLNMGDCLSYAATKVLNLRLLYKGNDFNHTDIASALSQP